MAAAIKNKPHPWKEWGLKLFMEGLFTRTFWYRYF